ncbi:MAG: septal ring lytic transglycosylase RlpA family protein [Ignavibacteriae bacterium]|nr:septal ring lytic transglycosylase RlpA family protein [Ignavibacteriota bacterium]
MDKINFIFNYYSGFLLLIILSSCSSTKQISNYDNSSGKLIETGIASWYGPNFDGKKTANGETFDMFDLTAAHRTLPFGSIVKVINKSNNKSVIVRINDRGPYAKSRIIDLSKKSAEKIRMISSGFTQVDLILLNEKKLPRNLKVPHYTVQIGSYKRKSDAVKVSTKVNNSKVIEASVNGKIFYRIYVGLFDNVDEANTKKKFLLRKGIKGFVKQFEN